MLLLPEYAQSVPLGEDYVMGNCEACGYARMNIPRHTDEAHYDLCCQSADHDYKHGDICITHRIFPEL